MLIDSQHVLSDAQAITGDAASTNVIDLGAANAGEGNRLGVRVQVDTTFDNLTSLDIVLQTDADSALGSPKTWWERNVLAADLVAGKVFDIGVVPEGSERYLRLYYDVNGTNPAAGALTAVLVPFGGQHIADAQI